MRRCLLRCSIPPKSPTPINPRVPSFDIYEVADNPSDGRMVRVSYVGQGQVVVSHYPQTGPRKPNPQDPTPQFDLTQRSSLHFRLHEVGEMVAVAEGKVPMASFHGDKSFITYQRDKSIDHCYVLEVIRTHSAGDPSGPTAPTAALSAQSFRVPFQRHFLIMWHAFLEAAIKDSFGFD